MLRNTKDLKGFTLGARDGEIGRIKDFYFEDQNWTIRYLVADTSKWLSGRKVLISPYGVKGIRAQDGVIDVNLTREQIQKSPTIDEQMPVSRQYEREYFNYYNWPYYWQGAALWGPGPFPVMSGLPGETPQEAEAASGDPHLRSMEGVAGYYIHAADGEMGHVSNFIMDDQNWMIRYVEVDTRNWWPGKHVLVAPEWVRDISWDRAKLEVDLPRDLIKTAPDYDTNTELTRSYEEQLHRHYSRSGYWDRQMAA